LAFTLLGVRDAQADVLYSTILNFNNSVTGVRGITAQSTNPNVIYTGSYVSGGSVFGLLYQGTIQGIGTSYTNIQPTPLVGSGTLTGSLFYGPNTPAFDASIGSSNIMAVGTFQTNGLLKDSGMLFQGSLQTGVGTWTAVNAPYTNSSGAPVFDTIPHSVMGDLVVGNYDFTNSYLVEANAFIFNKASNSYTPFRFNVSSNDFTTAYGIWQQGGSNSASYVIVGGSRHATNGGINAGYLVKYDSISGNFTNKTYYTIAGVGTNLLTHFEGITAVEGGYTVVATSETTDGTDQGAYFGFIATNSDGTFSTNVNWIPINFPGSSTTTGNTVYGSNAMGIYIMPGVSGEQVYLASIMTSGYLNSVSGAYTVASGSYFSTTNAVNYTGTTLTVNGSLVAPTVTIGAGSTLMGTGTLSLTGGNLTVNGTFAPGNSPGTFFVSGGNLIMGSTSVWDQQIYSASVYDQVVVTGSAILNGTMNITTDGVTQLQFGQKYNFLTASGGISGAFSSIEMPSGYRGRFLLTNNNTQANILIAPASYTQLAANRNQSNVATALDSFIPYTSGDQLVVSTSLDSLTASQYNQAFNAIMPTFYQQIATIAFNNANAQNMQLVQRLWGLRVAEGGGFSMSGLADNMPLLEGQGDGKGVMDPSKDILRPGLDNHWGIFVDGNGIFAQANSGNMLPGYNSQSGGVTTGLTYKWNENVGTGIYCGYQGTYTKSGADGSGLGTGSRLIDNAVRFGVFGTYGQKDGKGLFVNALAGGGYHNFQATRVIQYAGMNRTANSVPGAGELDTMLAAGYDIKKDKFTFGPTASLQYTYLGVNSLNETGAQSLSFNSGGWNSSSMLSSVGAHAAYSWVASKNILVVPQVNLSWQHEFMQNPYAISGNLGGTSPTFSNWSATPIRDFLYTGVGFTVEFAKRWNTSFFYNAAAGNSDLVSQNIFWSAGVKF
jgi:hypothetical protein